MVRFPAGGKKKKLKQKVAAIEVKMAYRNPHVAAIRSVDRRKVRATVVGFACKTLKYSSTTPVTTRAQVAYLEGARSVGVTNGILARTRPVKDVN